MHALLLGNAQTNTHTTQRGTAALRAHSLPSLQASATVTIPERTPLRHCPGRPPSPLEVIKCHHLCLDEATLKVRMDDTSSLGRQVALQDRPAAHLHTYTAQQPNTKQVVLADQVCSPPSLPIKTSSCSFFSLEDGPAPHLQIHSRTTPGRCLTASSLYYCCCLCQHTESPSTSWWGRRSLHASSSHSSSNPMR